MKSLAEIEAAVEALPPEKKEELLRYLADRLRVESSAPSADLELSHSRRGFPVSKGRALFSSEDVAQIESDLEANL